VHAAGFVLKEIAVVGDGQVDVLVRAAQAVNEEGRDIGKAASFGTKSFGIDAESFGDVGDFRSDEEDPWSFF